MTSLLISKFYCISLTLTESRYSCTDCAEFWDWYVSTKPEFVFPYTAGSGLRVFACASLVVSDLDYSRFKLDVRFLDLKRNIFN